MSVDPRYWHTTARPVIFEGSNPNGEEFAPRIVARFGDRFRVVEEYDEEDGSIRALERVSYYMGSASWRPVKCTPHDMYPLLEALRALCRHGVIEP